MHQPAGLAGIAAAAALPVEGHLAGAVGDGSTRHRQGRKRQRLSQGERLA